MAKTKKQVKQYKLKKHLSYRALFECGLCGKRIGGGRVGLVTHAVFWHDWRINEVQDKSKYIGEYE